MRLCGDQTETTSGFATRRVAQVAAQPGTEHVVENIGPGKLYTLTVMVPNEEFAERIRRGSEIALDQDDLNVLRRLPLRR
jgi:hypothetical protein